MKRILTFLVIAACVAGVSVSAAVAKPAKQATTVTIAMHDPGCHWFLVGSKYTKTLSVHGPVSLLNVDEATLKVAGPQGLELARVGHRLALGKGIYHITMVGQAPDDNHLLLTIK
jgi:hypothetical protein